MTDRTSRPPEPRLSYAVAFLERSVRRALTESLRPFDLTVAQYTVLWLLGNLGGLSNAQLARRAYITPQAMNEVLRHLEARKLAVRQPSPSHARVHPAHLTDHGRELLESCDDAVDAMERPMLDSMSRPDRDSIVETLMQSARILEHVDRSSDPTRHDRARSGAAGVAPIEHLPDRPAADVHDQETTGNRGRTPCPDHHSEPTT